MHTYIVKMNQEENPLKAHPLRDGPLWPRRRCPQPRRSTCSGCTSGMASSWAGKGMSWLPCVAVTAHAWLERRGGGCTVPALLAGAGPARGAQ